MSIKAFIQRHPVVSYFVMTYLISWFAAFLVVAPVLLRGRAIPELDGVLMFPALLLGPSITGITLTAIVDGKSGLRNLFTRMGHVRAQVSWYAAALLIPPALILLVLFSFSALLSPVFMPSLHPINLLFGIIAGFLEEIGWSGYAFPKMRLRRNPLSASLLLGVLWGCWHLPVIDFLGAASPHGAYWLPYALAFIVALVALRVLIAWIYSHTNSIPLAQIMHASSTGCLAALSPVPILPAQEALWYAGYAIALWIVIAIVVAMYGKRLLRQERPGRSNVSNALPQ